LNNGAFVQIAPDRAPDGGVLDARGRTGIEIEVFGNGEHYNLHLRTADIVWPWLPYRVKFLAKPE
jgi:hypothetical protein